MKLRPLFDVATRSRLLPPLMAAALALLAPRDAEGGLIISVQSVTANAGSFGNALDVTLTNTGPPVSTIGAFSFEISTGNPNITFTDATTGTTQATYIFSGFSLFGPSISTSS